MFYLIKNKIKTILISGLVLLAFSFGFYFYWSNFLKGAQAEPAKSSHDVIGVRVITKPSNDKYLSAKDWAQKNGFGGSEIMIIDGYRAVRSGRSIYVNAINTSGNDLSAGNSFYANIYVLSYNQDPDKDTIEIFRQIAKNWKFNINLESPGVCSENSELDCQYDSDCEGVGFCQSDKAKLTRDAWRLEDLSLIKLAFEAYREKYNSYPAFPAGTYVANNSVSTWPSWKQEIESKLGLKMPIDPRNKLGECDSRFEAQTCWDNLTKEYGGPISAGKIGLPNSSFAYYLWADGLGFQVCAIMESGINDSGLIGSPNNVFCLKN